MMKPPTTAIVGAGIAGIVAAYFEALRGNQVYLIEAAPRAGGLLQSDVTAFGHFDYGTHVATFTGVEALDQFLFGGMADSDFIYFNPGLAGNYFAGSLSEVSPFLNTRALPKSLINQTESELLGRAKGSSYDNLKELMVARFGPTIYSEALSGVVSKLFGSSASSLTPESVNLFDMNRVLAFDAATSERLKRQAGLDEALGYHEARPGQQKVYPRHGGIGFWIGSLMDKLAEAGVIFLPATAVEGALRSGAEISHLQLASGSLPIDHLVWTIAPGLFSKLVDFPVAFPRPATRMTALYDFAFLKPFNTDCYYINVHDTAKLACRITLYPNLASTGDYHTCTIEVLGADDFDFESSRGAILDEIRAIGIVSEDNRCVYQGMRFVSNGFPVPELAYSSQTIAQTAALDAGLDNVSFIGRAPGRFFMKDVLIHAYRMGEASAVSAL